MAGAGSTAYLDRLFTIAPTRPFLAVLARALFAGDLIPGFDAADPAALADATILVPTRRAARALHLALLEASGRRALLLPQIRPIGDVEEDPFEAPAGAMRADDPDAATPALAEMPPFVRQLALTRLVLAWKQATAAAMLHPVTRQPVDVPATVAEAVHLADALTALMDQVATEGVGWARLPDLAPADHARYWDLSLKFLEIVTKVWPDLLAERGWEDPGQRRDRLIRRAAARLVADPPKGPVIVAGSTGSVPATAELIRAVVRLEKGAVVLPGLDQDLDAASWAAIGTRDDQVGVGHPQYGLKLLLDRLSADRVHVRDLDPEPDAALVARTRLVADAMRPTATTEVWVEGSGRPPAEAVTAALAGVALLEARHEGEEALAVAVALRAAHAEGRTAALVTPDRTLARRVSVELGRFGLAVDDSAGQPLAGTPAATLARLVADVVLGDGDAVTLAGLLHHPALRLGLPVETVSTAARTVEILALRGPAPAPGIAGLKRAFAAAEAERAGDGRVTRARRRLSPAALSAGRDLILRLERATDSLAALAGGAAPLAALVAAHAATLAALAAEVDDAPTGFLATPDGAVLVETLADLSAAAAGPEGDVPLTATDYPSVFMALLAGRPVRRPGGPEIGLAILGPLEARLQRFDRLILGGLVDGVWPAQTTTDPWLSRPMKAGLGLEAPERRIGLSAHDFTQGLGAPDIILCRALKRGGAPTVPSRWLQRLLAVIGPDEAKALRARAKPYLDWATALDRPAAPPRPIARPVPAPPVARRPIRLSVTEIETWIRDPYALYARHVLKLEPLDAIGEVPDAAARGTIVHAVLARFVAEARVPADLADLDRFRAVADAELKAIAAFPGLAALWRARLANIGRWFCATEPARYAVPVERVTEIKGGMAIGEHFTLSGRADRLDRLGDGTLVVVDYKTGAPPSSKQVTALLAPQLPLEAAMAAAGGFGDAFRGASVAGLVHVHLSGAGEGGRWIDVKTGTAKEPGPSFDELAAEARARLAQMVAAYRRPEQGYASRPRIAFERRLDGPYDHLARVAEWSLGGGEDGEGEA